MTNKKIEYFYRASACDAIRYDTIVEFSVDSKAECDQLNLAHEMKQANANAHLFQYRFKIREGSPEGTRSLWRKGFVTEMSFESGMKG